MSAWAFAITIFHPPSDPERFSRWVAGHQACARHSFGYVSARESVQGNGQLDWAVEVAFDNADLLDAWLDSPERQAVLSDGEAHGYWRCASDLILAEGEPDFPQLRTESRRQSWSNDQNLWMALGLVT